MFKKVLLVSSLVAGAAFLGAPAFAQAKHPMWVAQIDAALPSAKLTPSERSQVVKLRNQGEKEHNAGNHGAAEVSLSRALSILKSH
jgi:hypothetical protein